MPLDRRRFLHTAAATLPLSALAARLGAEPPAVPRRFERVHAPQNLETNFAALNRFITPTDSFYVRNHFPVPLFDRDVYRLVVEGAVEKRLILSLDELKNLAANDKPRPLTMECAGNGRVFLSPPVRGVNWQTGAVGTAEWTGVPLSRVLDAAGLNPDAVEVVLVGADHGTVAEPPSPGPIHFARSLPLAKAQRPEVLLAWGMNGADLKPVHGAPLRAVVGGWYGMASVKWLSSVIVVTKPFQGFFQTLDYTYFRRERGLPTMEPIGPMWVKSQIARPAPHDVVPAGKPFTISGAAWAGEQEVARVEISTDGGKTWNAATLGQESAPFCWRLWEFTWTSPPKGPAKLMARATDSQGRSQPMDRDPDLRTYIVTHVVPVEVEVK